MKVEVTKSFLWAPDGNNVRTVKVGEIFEGGTRGAVVTMETGRGRILDAPSVAPVPAPAPVVEAVTAPIEEAKPELTDEAVQEMVDREPAARGEFAPSDIPASPVVEEVQTLAPTPTSAAPPVVEAKKLKKKK